MTTPLPQAAAPTGEAIKPILSAMEVEAIDHGGVVWLSDSTLGFLCGSHELLRASLAEETATRERLAALLERTATALKGEPAEGYLHDWSDLPEVATALRASVEAGREERDSLLRALEQSIGEIGFDPFGRRLFNEPRRLSVRQCRIIGIPESLAGNFAVPRADASEGT